MYPQGLLAPHVTVVIGNESGDLDSIVAALVRAYWISICRVRKEEMMVIPVSNISRADFPLRTEVCVVLRREVCVCSFVISQLLLNRLSLDMWDL